MLRTFLFQMLTDAHTTLSDGTRVRVRLPHTGDRPGLHALHARLGVRVEDLDLARTLRFDPRRRSVVVATAWFGGAESVVAYAAMDLDADAPDLLVADERLAPGIGETLVEALHGRAAARRAA